MHIGKSYKLSDFLVWTRKNIYTLVILGTIPVLLYHLLGLKWLAVPWTVVSLLGTATAFIVGFKNTQTYSRTWDAHSVWTGVVSTSRIWAIACRDYLHDVDKTRLLYYRHFAWLTALRHQMRENRVWEVQDKRPNAEYQRYYYSIPERSMTVEGALAQYLPDDELAYICSVRNKPAQILSLQSQTLKEIYDAQAIVPAQFLDMERAISTLYTLQAQCESVKDTPYPRQYSIINTIFVRIFCLLLPFGMLQEFDKLNSNVTGIMQGHMIWLVIPFSVLISWMYTSLVQVGESTENPFEGSANDVPISQICRNIEIDLREMLGETVLPPPLEAENDILI